MNVKVAQSCPTLRPHGIVHGILQARIVEGVAVCFFRGSSQPRDQIQVSHIAGRFFTSWATREAHAWLTSWSNLYFRRVTLVAMGKLDWRFTEHAWRPAPEDFSWIHEFDAWHGDKTLLAISYSRNWSPGRWRSKMVEWVLSKVLVSKINCFYGKKKKILSHFCGFRLSILSCIKCK